MAITLHNLNPGKSANKKRKRIGRGNGSKGSYSGRGMKGQKARTGKKIKAGFEGGQTPLIQKLPKLKGFKNPNRAMFQVVNLKDLEIFNNGDIVDQDTLLAKGLVRKKNYSVKILGMGELSKKLTVTLPCSSVARQKIEKAGGKVAILEEKNEKGNAENIKVKKESIH